MPEAEERGEFSLFPKLPLELRLRIWVMSFKKQHVDLDIQSLWGSRGAPTWVGPVASVRQQFPTTLHVNRESRIETLSRYCIVIPGGIRATRARLPICVNLSLDSFSSSLDLLGDEKYAKDYTKWLTKLDSIAHGGLKAVKELEIRDIWWASDMKNDFEGGSSPPKSFSFMVLRALGAILRFAGLNTVQFTYSWTLQWAPYPTLWSDMKECREALQAFLNRNSVAFVGGRPPEVKVRVWKPKCECLHQCTHQSEGYVCSTQAGEQVWEEA